MYINALSDNSADTKDKIIAIGYLKKQPFEKYYRKIKWLRNLLDKTFF